MAFQISELKKYYSIYGSSRMVMYIRKTKIKSPLHIIQRNGTEGTIYDHSRVSLNKIIQIKNKQNPKFKGYN